MVTMDGRIVESFSAEDTGKSLKNALDVLWYAKRYLSG